MKKSLLLLSLPALLGAAIAVPAAPAAEVKPACALLTAEDAAAALGGPVGPALNEPNATGAPGGSSCKFRLADASQTRTLSLTVQYSKQDLAPTFLHIEKTLRSGSYQNVQKVPGVGDSAIWGTTSLMGTLVGELSVFRKPSLIMIIMLNGAPDAKTALDRARTVAEKALPRS